MAGEMGPSSAIPETTGHAGEHATYVNCEMLIPSGLFDDNVRRTGTHPIVECPLLASATGRNVNAVEYKPTVQYEPPAASPHAIEESWGSSGQTGVTGQSIWSTQPFERIAPAYHRRGMTWCSLYQPT